MAASSSWPSDPAQAQDVAERHEPGRRVEPHVDEAIQLGGMADQLDAAVDTG
jgi:hypothetical protein